MQWCPVIVDETSGQLACYDGLFRCHQTHGDDYRTKEPTSGNGFLGLTYYVSMVIGCFGI